MNEVEKDEYTMFTMPVDSGDYGILKSFCEDFGIDNFPDREQCAITLNYANGLIEKSPPLQTGFLMNKLELIVMDSTRGDGDILAVMGESPTIEAEFIKKTRYLLTNGYEPFEDEPAMYVIISSNFEPAEDFDVNALTLKLKSYLGDTLAFMEIKTTHGTLEDMEYASDGMIKES